MTKHNANNERIKREYLAFLKGAKGLSEASLDGVASALSRFENCTQHRDFKLFHTEQAIAFKKHLAEQKAQRTGEQLSKATLHATFNQLKQFFQWLSREPGYKKRIKYSDADYFNLGRNDTHIATAKREKRWPTLDQIKHTLSMMPETTDIERRNRALFAFTILTGARDSAIASMKMKHVSIAQGCVYQDARDVKTKFRKTFTTDFFPVGEEIRKIVEDWVTYLQTEQLWSNDDPLFPKTQLAVGTSQQFEAAGLKREHWSTATPIRAIFKEAFGKAGLPYFNPHSFRNTLVQLCYSKCRTHEQTKAWSQNLGHDSVLTTLTSYGEVGRQRQAEILQGMAYPQQAGQPDQNELADTIVQRLLKHGIALPTSPVT
ncbi:MAG: tyrosine-type recombinase/integrase [Gallionella sp.]|nr:tyrosine-type recombinase/integrase [Gallionella sp.]